MGDLENQCMIPYEDIRDLSLTLNNAETNLNIESRYEPDYFCQFRDDDVPENEEDVNLDSVKRINYDGIRKQEFRASRFNQYYRETIKKALKEVFERIENLSLSDENEDLSDENEDRINIYTTEDNSKVIELEAPDGSEYKIVVDKNDEILELWFWLLGDRYITTAKDKAMIFNEETWIKTYVNPLVREFLYGEESFEE